MRFPNKSRRHNESGLLAAAAFIVAALCISVLSYLAGVHSATGRLQSIPVATALVAAVDTAERDPQWPGPGSMLLRSRQATSTAGLIGNNSRPQTGRHIMLDYYNIPEHVFSAVADIKALLRIVSQLVQQSSMHLIGHSCHVFANTQGITCVFLLSESHLSIHTWPEHGFAAVDIYTCGKQSQPEVMETGLARLLDPGLTLRQEQARGVLDIANLTTEQRRAKVLHNILVNDEDGDLEGMRQVLHQVPIIYSYMSPYQLIQVTEVRGQMGRCLLLDRIIQFCSYDLDAYTDHMARQPLQMLQRLHGCAAPAETGGLPTRASSQQRDSRGAQYGAVTAAYPLAASDPIPERVTCRSHLLHSLGSPLSAADDSIAASKCNQQKARVLIVGGGDGWIAKQLIECYEDWVSSVQLVELDREVSRVTQQFFGKGGAGGSGGPEVNPFKHPSIYWEYTDAFAWAQKQADYCGTSGLGGTARVGHGYADNLGAVEARQLPKTNLTAVAKSNRRSLITSTVATNSTSSSGFGLAGLPQEGTSTSADVSSSKPSCPAFDVVIIDSTDFTQRAASQLVSTAFYKALYKLMRPKAALLQQVETHTREFQQHFAAIEAAMGEAGWTAAGRSSVYNPSYGGETVFLQAVKV